MVAKWAIHMGLVTAVCIKKCMGFEGDLCRIGHSHGINSVVIKWVVPTVLIAAVGIKKCRMIMCSKTIRFLFSAFYKQHCFVK